MGILALLIIAIGGAGSIIYLLLYLPLTRVFRKKVYSPRLTACKVLAPLDVFMTIFLVAGSWIGLTTAVTGIGMMIFNVLTGIGISLGVVLVRKVCVPSWTKQHELEKQMLKRSK